MPAASADLTAPRRRSWTVRALLLLFVLAALLVAYTWLALAWHYSDGERAGLLQKFSRKGWLCKTYEGELALYVVAGVQPEIWSFTVRDPALATQLASAVGSRVQLHYTEHPGLPTACFGDTRYFVDRINRIADGPSVVAPVGGPPEPSGTR